MGSIVGLNALVWTSWWVQSLDWMPLCGHRDGFSRWIECPCVDIVMGSVVGLNALVWTIGLDHLCLIIFHNIHSAFSCFLIIVVYWSYVFFSLPHRMLLSLKIHHSRWRQHSLKIHHSQWRQHNYFIPTIIWHPCRMIHGSKLEWETVWDNLEWT